MKQTRYGLLMMVFVLINMGMANATQSEVELVDATIAGVRSEHLNNSVKALQQKKHLTSKSIKRSGASRDIKKLARKFKKLNRDVIKTPSDDLTTVSGFVLRYEKIERQADHFAAKLDTSEGKGACMRECADNFPGTGGGNGVNRLACKLSCLILGE